MYLHDERLSIMPLNPLPIQTSLSIMLRLVLQYRCIFRCSMPMLAVARTQHTANMRAKETEIGLHMVLGFA